MKVLAIGDIVGERAVEKLEKELKQLQDIYCNIKMTKILDLT